MTENTEICRLCLLIVVVNSKTSVELDDVQIEMCKIVLSSGVVVNSKSVICSNCFENLQQSFEFKTICLDSENFLNTLHLNGDKLILHEIVPQTVDIIKQEEELICRLCFRYFESKLFTDLSRLDDDFFLRDMMENCLPEINLHRTCNPVICQSCMTSLQNQFNLISTFVDTNDKINDYISYSSITSTDKVDLHKVSQFVLNIKKENVLFLKEEIKLEFSDDIQQTEVHIKMEENLSLEEEHKHICPDQTVPTTEFTKKPFKKNSQNIYSCNLCLHETPNRSSMILHQLKHNETVQFKCDKCDFVTKWRSSLHQHSWLHTEVQMHQCATCPYKTRYKKHLMRHTKRHNTSEHLKKYRCQHCKFTTENNTYFMLHNRIKHGTEVVFQQSNTFTCDRCNYVTHKKTFLTNHHNKMHKKYICEHCGFQTSKISGFKEHLLKHKKKGELVLLRCANCDFQTKYKSSLRGHVLLHSR